MEENSNNDIIQKGRKKVFEAKESMELLLPNGESDGILEAGDLIYVVQRYKVNGKDAYRFRVMKFVDTKKATNIYSGEQSFFKSHFDSKSNADGEQEVQSNGKVNYTVPVITGLGGGFLGYMFANKYQKNKWMFAIGGLAIGATIGVFLLKNKQK